MLNQVAAMRVLLIEDSEGDAMLTRVSLHGGGTRFLLEQVPTLGQALDRLDADADATSDTRPHVVLVDLNLPDSRGLATLDRVVARAPDVATIVLTGWQDEALGTEALRRGAQDYLVKNEITGPLLQRALLYAVERRRLMVLMESRTPAPKDAPGRNLADRRAAVEAGFRAYLALDDEDAARPGALCNLVERCVAVALAGEDLLRFQGRALDAGHLNVTREQASHRTEVLLARLVTAWRDRSPVGWDLETLPPRGV